MSDSLGPHELWHTRFSCLSLSPKFTQIYVHWLGDAIQLSHPLLLSPSIFPSTRVFSNDSLSASGGQSTGVIMTVLLCTVKHFFINFFFPLSSAREKVIFSCFVEFRHSLWTAVVNRLWVEVDFFHFWMETLRASLYHSCWTSSIGPLDLPGP